MTGITQQLECWRWIEHRCIEVASVGKCNSDADLLALREQPGCWSQIKHQLKWFSSWDQLQLALEVIVPGQAKIIERGRAQGPMGSSQATLSDVGRIPVSIHLFQVGENIQIGRVRAQPHVNDRMPGNVDC